MPFDCDVVVVGSGAGGSAFAQSCAKAGKSVLLIERGQKHRLPEPVHDEQAMLIDKKPYDDRAVLVNGLSKRLYMGGVLGGSTSLFGAALLRPSKDDFHPGIHYGARIPRAIWDWPIAYDDLEPFYQEAEELYGVAGCEDDDFGPLQRTNGRFPNQPLPLHPINQRLIAANRSNGLEPFRLPLAIDPARCLNCASCAGFICPTGARVSGAQLLDRASSDGLPLEIMTGVEAEKLLLDGTGNVSGISLVNRQTGERTVRRAHKYALAAGAIGSPLVLVRSGMDYDHVGRNYMFHLSPIVIGIFAGRTGADQSFVKQVGFTDYYFGSQKFAHKLGLIQSLPVPGPLLMAKMAPFLPKRVAQWLRQRMLPMVGIVEDLPNPDNQVSLDSAGQLRLRHQFGAYDLERGRVLVRLIAQILKRAGALFCLSQRFASDEHVAHQCGTIRFGKDPSHAVLDSDCRMFRHPNVFVVDGSFFPTSLGVGPALTIIANALRVARIVTAEV